MGKVRRLSNKELRSAIKRNDLEEAMEKSGEWIKDHLENVLIGAVLAVVLAVLVPYWFGNRSDQQAQSSTQLRAARSDFQRAQSAGEGKSEALRQARSKFQAVATTFGGSEAAIEASLAAAQADLELGDLDQAQANFQAFLGEFGSHEALAPLAMAGLAQVYEAQGHYEQAAAQYLSVEKRSLPAANLGICLLDAARCLRKAGKDVQAKEVYDRASKNKKNLGLNSSLLALAGRGL